jgi:hypothetical protein
MRFVVGIWLKDELMSSEQSVIRRMPRRARRSSRFRKRVRGSPICAGSSRH